MKLWVLSDLHRDWAKPHIEIPPEADVAVVAGDVCDDEWLMRLGETLPTVFVCGNHEFYGHEYAKRLEELRNLPSSQLYVLENEPLIMGGVRFLGCTLWTDYNRGDQAAMSYARDRMNDHIQIRIKEADGAYYFTPNDALNLHFESRHWLKQRFSVPFDGKTVVITHHCPSERSVAPKYAGNPLNYAFLSALDAEIERWSPSLWVHGHTHHNFSYEIGKTHVVCNPGGYPGENPFFSPNLIVEV